jgi:hypothetical protein
LIVVSWKSRDWKSRTLAVCGITLVSFVTGCPVSADWARATQINADGGGVFELRIYHAVPGKMPALEGRFRESTSKLLARHGLKVVGYWVAEDATGPHNVLNNTFIFLVAHPSRAQAKRNWAALWADPGFQDLVKSEKANKLVESVDSTYMRPTDFSPMK